MAKKEECKESYLLESTRYIVDVMCPWCSGEELLGWHYEGLYYMAGKEGRAA